MVESSSKEPAKRLPFVGELEIEQDLEFERREWLAERIAWLLMAVFVMLAAAGLFGGGVLSRAEATEGGLTASYQRFVRLETATDLDVDLATLDAKEQPLRITWSPQHKVEVRTVLPEPARMEGLRDGVVYYFDPAQGSSTARAHIEYVIGDVGSTTIRLDSGSGAIEFEQFVYP